jgi:hypothetical protein
MEKYNLLSKDQHKTFQITSLGREILALPNIYWQKLLNDKERELL